MTRAIHWDYAEAFSGREAAYLIAGLGPSSNSPEDAFKASFVIKRMKKAYYSACTEFRFDSDYLSEDDQLMYSRNTKNTENLLSWELEQLVKSYEESDYVKSGNSFISSLSDKPEHEAMATAARMLYIEWTGSDAHEFDDQYFSRHELHRWIHGNRLPSEYQFTSVREDAEPAVKALASTERNSLLVIIAALCKHAEIDITARTTASTLANLTDKIGALVTDDTVRKVLKQVPDALASRQK